MTKMSDCFDYKNGQLIWKSRPAHHFKSESAHRVWSKKFVGKPAGGIFRKRGKPAYMQVRIDNRQYLAHRIIWEIVVGEIPNGLFIDHINGNGLDNRIENLRIASSSQNQRNSALDNRNKSGIHGVRFVARIGGWMATIYREVNERIYLGSFATLLDAAAARKAAEIEYGYHANHGRELKARLAELERRA